MKPPEINWDSEYQGFINKALASNMSRRKKIMAIRRLVQHLENEIAATERDAHEMAVDFAEKYSELSDKYNNLMEGRTEGGIILP